MSEETDIQKTESVVPISSNALFGALGYYWNLYRKEGFYFLLDTFWDRDGNFHEIYWHGYEEGLRLPEDEVKHLILILAMDIPKYQPQKNRALCQIRGFSDALKSRFIRAGQAPNVES
jgi:hypothetical protein